MDIGKIEQLTNHGEGKIAPKGVVMPVIDPLIDAPRATLAAPNKIPAPETLRHDWAYAITPVFNNEFSGGIYLTGFCKNCQTAFTSRLHTENDWQFIGKLDYTKFDIPLFGCEYKRY